MTWLLITALAVSGVAAWWGLCEVCGRLVGVTEWWEDES